MKGKKLNLILRYIGLFFTAIAILDIILGFCIKALKTDTVFPFVLTLFLLCLILGVTLIVISIFRSHYKPEDE